MSEHSETTPMEVALALHRAYSIATRRLNAALQPMGLGSRHVTAMFLIRDGIRTHGDLVRHQQSDETGMVRTIDDFERLGLVSRTRSADDRRMWLLALTPVGSETLAQAQQHTRAVAEVQFGGLEQSELLALRDGLSRVLRRLTQERRPQLLSLSRAAIHWSR